MVAHVTSTDNPAAELADRELKEESGLDAPVALGSATEAAERVETARHRLDEGRLRATRGWKTAARVDAELPEAERLVDRATFWFYVAARSAVEAAVLGVKAPRARRTAERDAVWTTLETCGLARRHLGARRTPNPRRPMTESPFTPTPPPGEHPFPSRHVRGPTPEHDPLPVLPESGDYVVNTTTRRCAPSPRLHGPVRCRALPSLQKLHHCVRSTDQLLFACAQEVWAPSWKVESSR